MKELIDKYDAVALFSGGLDSILAMRVIMDQGLKVLGLHFCSPFFGTPDAIEKWKQLYNIDVYAVDITEELHRLPHPHGHQSAGNYGDHPRQVHYFR